MHSHAEPAWRPDHDQEPHSSPGPSAKSGESDFGAQWWETHYRISGAAAGGPGAQLMAEVADLLPGTSLDAGCGAGGDAIWLAEQGWQVTAVDISPTAVQQARSVAEQQDSEVAERINWLVADFARWQPPRQYDLVISQYVHPDLPFADFVARLADAVAPGGTLLVVGHHSDDHHSASHAPQDASIDLTTVVGVLDPGQWTVLAADKRSRSVTRGSTELTFADVVVKARRHPAG